MDKGNMEMNVHGGEIDDVELDPEKETSADPVRTRRVDMKDQEDVAAEELYQARRSVGGYLARVSTVINQVKTALLRDENVKKFVKL